ELPQAFRRAVGRAPIENARRERRQAPLVLVDDPVEQLVEVVAPLDEIQADLVKPAQLGEIRENRLGLGVRHPGQEFASCHDAPRCRAGRPEPARRSVMSSIDPPPGTVWKDTASTSREIRYIP